MATVSLAIGTSHMPGLNNPVERWFTRAESDRRHLELHQLGDYEELCRQRASWIGPEITEDRIRQKYAACQEALKTLAEVLERTAPDVIVIVGDDHREVFSAEHMPAFDIHWADQIYAPPFVGGATDNGGKQFAAGGKAIGKKDLGLIAMTYGHIYVASVALPVRPRTEKSRWSPRDSKASV